MVFALLALGACREVGPEDTPTPEPPPTPWSAVEVLPTDVTAVAEVLSELPAEAAVPIAPADLLVSREERLESIDPLHTVTELVFGISTVRAAAAWEGTLLLATDEGLHELDGGLVISELDALVSGVETMIPLRSGLWLEADAGVVRVVDGDVQAVTLDGEPARGLARGTVGSVPVVWTSVGDRVVALHPLAGELTVIETMQLFDPVDDLAASTDGRVLALVGGWPVRRDPAGTWERLDVGEPVRSLAGQRGAEVIWARTDTAWLAFGPEEVLRTDVPAAIEVEDDHGRLIEVAEHGVVRWSVGYPLLLLDVPADNVLATAQVKVVPTAPDRVLDLEVRATPLAGDALTLPVLDGAVTIDGETWAPGLWTLEATATYDDAVEVAVATVEVGADFVPTWPEHIQPIFAANCTPCHEGGQGVIDLSSEANWITYLEQGSRPGSDGILERIANDNMPSDSRVLTDTEKLLVRLWADGVVP